MSGKIEKVPYKVEYKKPAEKFFRKHEDVRQEYENLLWEIYCGKHPEKVDRKLIHGTKGNYYRLRIGNWRVIYMVEGNKVFVINTLTAGSRGDIYKKIDGLKIL